VFEEEIGRVRGHFGPLRKLPQSRYDLNKFLIAVQIPLPSIRTEKATRVEERTAMLESTSSTKAISISRTRLKDRQKLKDKCKVLSRDS
jgi:hypothetical protein